MTDYQALYEKERARRQEMDDEAFEYSEQVEILREALDELRWHDSHRDPGEVEVIARRALERVGFQDVRDSWD